MCVRVFFFLIVNFSHISWSDRNGRGWRGRAGASTKPPPPLRPPRQEAAQCLSLSGSLRSEGNANEDNKDRALSLVTLTKIQTADKIESRLGCGELATLGRAAVGGRAGGSWKAGPWHLSMCTRVPSSASTSPLLPSASSPPLSLRSGRGTHSPTHPHVARPSGRSLNWGHSPPSPTSDRILLLTHVLRMVQSGPSPVSSSVKESG